MVYETKDAKYWSDYSKAEEERATQDFWIYIDQCEEHKSNSAIEEWLQKTSNEYKLKQFNITFMTSLQLAVRNNLINKHILDYIKTRKVYKA